MRLSSGTWLLIVALVAGYVLAIINKTRVEGIVNREPTTIVDNPVYDQMEPIARKLGLDVGFAKRVSVGKMDVLNNLVFSSPPNSWDVLVFGDSALGWSFSSRLAEQVSGLRIAFVAQSRMLANKPIFELSEKLASRYLKPNGKVVYLFSSGDWIFAASEPPLTPDLRSLTGMVIPDAPKTTEALGPQIERLLALPSVSFYHQWIEAFILPKLAKEMKEKQYGVGCLQFNWEEGGGSQFYLCDRRRNSHPEARDALLSPLDSEKGNCDHDLTMMESNIRDLGKVRIRNKVIAIPFANGPGVATIFRCVSQQLLDQNGITMLDLPVEAKRLFGDITLEFEGGPHVANASPVLTSYVLGKALAMH